MYVYLSQLYSCPASRAALMVRLSVSSVFVDSLLYSSIRSVRFCHGERGGSTTEGARGGGGGWMDGQLTDVAGAGRRLVGLWT